MDLKLANDVVYAILATVGFIFLVVYTTRIIRIRASLSYDEAVAEGQQQLLERQRAAAPFDQPINQQATAPWPAVTQETEK